MTNREWLDSLRIEEFAEFLVDWAIFYSGRACVYCRYYDEKHDACMYIYPKDIDDKSIPSRDLNCVECSVKWLEAEHEEVEK